MFKTSIHGLLLATLAASLAQAQPAPPAKVDPLDPNASVPRVEHRSSLATYRRHSDEPVRSWREANDNVTRIGGWRTYLREAREPESAASTADRAPVAPTPSGTKPQ